MTTVDKLLTNSVYALFACLVCKYLIGFYEMVVL